MSYTQEAETLVEQSNSDSCPSADAGTLTVENLRLKAAAARKAGMTLIEIMIVVVIMALVATGVGIAVVPQLQKAKIKQADSGVQVVRSAVQLYIATNN